MRTNKLITFVLFPLLVLFFACTKGDIKRNGCTTSPLVIILDSTGLTFPNVFTPNGDGKNDLFWGYTSGPFTYYSVVIKDGSKILFSSSDYEEAWDGTQDGKDVKEGVYDFEFDAIIEGYTYSEKRKITLIRDVEKYKIKDCGKCGSIWPENFCN